MSFTIMDALNLVKEKMRTQGLPLYSHTCQRCEEVCISVEPEEFCSQCAQVMIMHGQIQEGNN